MIIKGKITRIKSKIHATCLSKPIAPNKWSLINVPKVGNVSATANTRPITTVKTTLNNLRTIGLRPSSTS